MGDFSVDRTPGDCTERVEEHLNGMGFVATQDGTGSTRIFRENDGRSKDDPSLLKTMVGVASNIVMSSSSGREDSEPSRSVQVVVLEEGDGSRLVVDASEPDLQKSLDEWVRTDLGGRPQN